MQSLQILGTACEFSSEELARAFDEATIDHTSEFTDGGPCSSRLLQG